MKKAACLLLLIEDKDAYLETFNILIVERLNESKNWFTWRVKLKKMKNLSMQ